MVISKQTGFTLPQQTAPILTAPSDGNGDFGFAITTALILGAGALLGGGTIWQFHEKRQERDKYLECVKLYTEPPYNMPPEEAGMVCRGEEVGKFDFGLNAKTLLLVLASVFGMYFVTQLLINTAKAKLSGRKGG